jgi:ATPase subunit of ABC transporter with duplicated ATPase domains
LARGVLGDPPLLLLDRIDADLDEAGLEVLRSVVAEYPGVVLFASDAPDRVAGDYATLVLGR